MSKPEQTTFDQLNNGDKFYRGTAKNTLWMKVSATMAARCEIVDGKIKVTVVEKAETPVAPNTAVTPAPASPHTEPPAQ